MRVSDWGSGGVASDLPPTVPAVPTPGMRLRRAVAAGSLIGLARGALGGGGSIMAVPVLVSLLDQSASQATTGSLVVVGVTSLIGAIAAHRAGNVLVGRGLVFGLVAIGGAVAGAEASDRVYEEVLLAAFAALMLLVRSEEHTSETPVTNAHLVFRLLLE